MCLTLKTHKSQSPTIRITGMRRHASASVNAQRTALIGNLAWVGLSGSLVPPSKCYVASYPTLYRVMSTPDPTRCHGETDMQSKHTMSVEPTRLVQLDTNRNNSKCRAHLSLKENKRWLRDGGSLCVSGTLAHIHIMFGDGNPSV